MNSFQNIIFYTPMIVILFWGVTISVSISKEQNRFKLPFLYFLIDAFAAILVGSFFHTMNYDLYRMLYVPGAFFALAMFPLFHIFIISLTKEVGVQRSDYLRHLAFPICCMLIAAAILLLWGDLDLRTRFIEDVLAHNIIEGSYLHFIFWMDKVLRMLFIVVAIVYFILTERRIKMHKDAIINYFSNTEEVGVNWYKSFRVVFSLTLIAGLIYYSLDRAMTIENIYIPSISRMLLALFFWVIGFYVSKQKLIYVEVEVEKEMPIEEISDEMMRDLALVLDELMVKERRFTDSTLTLPLLAAELGTNRTYLSRLFNTHLKISFNAYINQRRVSYAKELLMKDTCEVAAVYDECGFKSASNFYRVFSANVGTTPMKYHKENVVIEKFK